MRSTRSCANEARAPGTWKDSKGAGGCCSITSNSSCTCSITRPASTTCSSVCGATRERWSLVWNELTEGLAEALRAADLYTPERLKRLELAIPREAGHGDWTTNLALVLAKEVGSPPRKIAEAIASAFPVHAGPIGA